MVFPSKMKIDVELYKKLQNSPILFIDKVWKLIPQPIKPEYYYTVNQFIENGDYELIKPDMFVPFFRGRHITWQQWLILLAVESALKGKSKKRISIRSGHGIGKSAVLAWLLIWFLFTRKDAQIPCTAPTSAQLYDILWKESAKWLKAAPPWLREKY
jgi:hypothetical protein